MLVTITHPVMVKGKSCERGDVVEISDTDAAELIRRQRAEPAKRETVSVDSAPPAKVVKVVVQAEPIVEKSIKPKSSRKGRK